MRAGDLIVYIEGTDPKTGQPFEYNALVLGDRHVADHGGAADEPVVTLAFVKERLDQFGNPLPLHGTGQTSELIQVRLDVAHVSHAYTDDQKAKYERSAYDGGRWREFADEGAPTPQAAPEPSVPVQAPAEPEPPAADDPAV